MKVLLDTSVLVASPIESHAMHARAHPWLGRALGGEFEWAVAANSLPKSAARIAAPEGRDDSATIPQHLTASLPSRMVGLL